MKLVKVKDRLFELNDDRLSPMTYSKLKEMGYTSEDWKDWDQEHANKVVAQGKQENKKQAHPEPHGSAEKVNAEQNGSYNKEHKITPISQEEKELLQDYVRRSNYDWKDVGNALYYLESTGITRQKAVKQVERLMLYGEELSLENIQLKQINEKLINNSYENVRHIKKSLVASGYKLQESGRYNSREGYILATRGDTWYEIEYYKDSWGDTNITDIHEDY